MFSHAGTFHAAIKYIEFLIYGFIMTAYLQTFVMNCTDCGLLISVDSVCEVRSCACGFGSIELQDVVLRVADCCVQNGTGSGL
jgi:hypothetical protein